MAKRTTGNGRWRVPDEFWKRVEPLLLKYRVSKQGLRPGVDRRVAAAQSNRGVVGGDLAAGWDRADQLSRSL